MPPGLGELVFARLAKKLWITARRFVRTGVPGNAGVEPEPELGGQAMKLGPATSLDIMAEENMPVVALVAA